MRAKRATSKRPPSFTDFKGFTEASELLTPQELVQELDTCFKAFDAIITARGIEKIKTIGDAYMAAGGLQRHAQSGVADVVHAALDTQAFMTERKASGPRAAIQRRFDMRGHPHGTWWPDRGGEEVPVRHLGRHREHRQPHGISR